MKRGIRYAATLLLALSLTLGSLSQMACGANDLHKLHDTLNKTARALNAAAKTNHSFYESGIYGVKGGDGAIKIRQKAATVIHGANEQLIVALNLAKGLTTETFESGKLGVLQALATAASGLTTGNMNIDLVLQSVATLINQAVVLVQAFQSQHLKYALPEIRTWQIAEVTQWAS